MTFDSHGAAAQIQIPFLRSLLPSDDFSAARPNTVLTSRPFNHHSPFFLPNLQPNYYRYISPSPADTFIPVKMQFTLLTFAALFAAVMAAPQQPGKSRKM